MYLVITGSKKVYKVNENDLDKATKLFGKEQGIKDPEFLKDVYIGLRDHLTTYIEPGVYIDDDEIETKHLADDEVRAKIIEIFGTERSEQIFSFCTAGVIDDSLLLYLWLKQNTPPVQKISYMCQVNSVFINFDDIKEVKCPEK